MSRTFVYSFEPPASCPVGGSTISLDVTEIEDAGIREVLQTPGAAYGSWSILDALLASTGPGTPFVFREPLGQAREVKVALSGLFGRFVARAYLTRYFNLTIFAHVSKSSLVLDGRMDLKVVRLSRGDLPDWIASSASLASLTVAEAKGCHDTDGPTAALQRAWKQASRIDVEAAGKPVSIKRIAIATRWAAESGGPSTPHLSVHDPQDEGESISDEQWDAVYIGILRRHVASLIAPLGHRELAAAISQLTSTRSAPLADRSLARAKQLLDTATTKDVEGSDQIDGLVGGTVTRAGPLGQSDISTADQDSLERLNLRPVFVGIERDLISSAIEGNAPAIRKQLDKPRADDVGRHDRAGGWIIPLGRERHIKDK